MVSTDCTAAVLMPGCLLPQAAHIRDEIKQDMLKVYNEIIEEPFFMVDYRYGIRH
jgi:hypothetical protein